MAPKKPAQAKPTAQRRRVSARPENKENVKGEKEKPPMRKPARKPRAKAEIKVKNPNHFSISQLASRYELDRATVRTRLGAAGIEPVAVAAKEKLYLLDERVESVLAQDAKDALQRLKLQSEIDLNNEKLKKARGEVIPKEEISQMITAIISTHYQNTMRAVEGLRRSIGAKHVPAVRKTIDECFEHFRNNAESYF